MAKINLKSMVLFLALMLSPILPISVAQAQFGIIFDLAVEVSFREPKSTETLTLLGRANERSFKNKETFEVLIWNVHKGDDPQWYHDIETLSAKSKIVMLQESFFTDDFNQSLLSKSSTQWVNAISFQMLHKKFTGTGVSTGSLVQSSRRDYLRTSFTEPVVKTSKLTLLTHYPIEGKGETLLAVNIHAINFVPTFIFRSELKRLSRELKKHHGPILLGGDFNTWTKGRQEALDKLAQENNLNSVPFADGARSTGLGRILDHAFVRGLTITRIDHLGEVTSSDHKPLRFQVQLQ